ncbi:MAG: LTA synthase family protein, partial [bacterium]
GSGTAPLSVLVSGFVQDIGVGAQMVLVSLLICRVLNLTHRGFFGISLGLLLASNIYFIVDFFLYLRLGIRMSFSHLMFLADPAPFLSSAQSLNPVAWLFGIVVVVVASVWLFGRYRDSEYVYQPQRITIIAVPLIGLAAFFYAIQNKSLSETYANALVKSQYRLWQSLETNPIGDIEPPQYVIPVTPQEQFEVVDSDYPLLKNTTGFAGERAFDIKVAPSENPHLVFLFLESYRAKDVGVLGGLHQASPEFDRLAGEGVLFKNFYATGVQTTRAVISSLFGVLPKFSELAVQSNQSGLPLLGLPEMFKKNGYINGFFHNGSLDFEGKSEFFGSHYYDVIYGGLDILAAYPDIEESSSWGLHDEYLMQYAVDWLAEQDSKGPAFLTMFTVSNHHPWDVPGWYEPPEFKNVDPALEYANYLRSFNYSDHTLGLFVKLLRERGLAKNTIVFIMADTATPMGEHYDNHMLISYLYEENLRIPLLILADDRVQATVIDDLGSQVDLLPTVMDIFGLSGLNHGIGTSLLRKKADRKVYFNNPFHLSYYGLRQGHLKFLYSLAEGKGQVFDLIADPTESENIANREGEFQNRSFEDIARMVGIHSYLYEQEKFISAEARQQYMTN